MGLYLGGLIFGRIFVSEIWGAYFREGLFLEGLIIAILRYLKGLRHQDFAVLGQFCAKIITKGLCSYTKGSCKTKRKISDEFYQGELIK